MTERRIQGIDAAHGIAIGEIVPYSSPQIATQRRVLAAEEIPSEIDRLQHAIQATRDRLEIARQTAAAQASETEAAIFEAHALMLDDPLLTGEIEWRIREEQQPAPLAVEETVANLVHQFEQIDDAYLRERASDVKDIGNQILRHLTGDQNQPADLPLRAIIVAEELLPSDITLFDQERVVAVVTERGSRTAHVSILARALGLPAIVGLSGISEVANAGQPAIVNGDDGELILDPEPETVALFSQRLREQATEQANLAALKELSAITTDGVRLDLMANIGSPAEAKIALEHGAAGIGLFRTEFLFLDRPELPSEDEQYAVYRQVTEIMSPRPVTIRALDAGGDKPIPAIDQTDEANPFLGRRGLRLLLHQPGLMRTQLRAILRAAVHGDVWLMLPMVTTVEEIQATKQVITEVAAELQAAGTPHRAGIPLGIMVEVPAAALKADLLIDEVDFFSIGSNDLIQYTLAVDRTNDELAQDYDPLDLAVLRLMHQTILAADRAGKQVGICGEIAGDVSATAPLIGLGLRVLSMTATSLSAVKAAIRGIDAAAATTVTRERLRLSPDQ